MIGRAPQNHLVRVESNSTEERGLFQTRMTE